MSPNSRASLIRAATSRRLIGREVLDLRLELLQPLLGDQRFTSHVVVLFLVLYRPHEAGLPAQKRPKRDASLRARARAGARDYSDAARRLEPPAARRGGPSGEQLADLVEARRVRWKRVGAPGPRSRARSTYQG